MVKMVIKILLIICIAFYVNPWNCTKNPFTDGDEISTPLLRGRVTLNDGLNPDNVYIWLKVLDINTRTDSAGYYELEIPAASHQPTGGLNGVFGLYFYVANYRIDSLQIVFVNGNVRDLRLKHNIELKKLLDINTNLPAFKHSVTDLDSFIVYFTVRAVYDPITIEGCFSKPVWTRGPQFMAGFLKRIDAHQDTAFRVIYENPKKGSRYVTFDIPNSEVELHPFLCVDESDEVPPGEYEVIPFIVVRQEGLPPGLWSSLGEKVEYFDPVFLNIPMKVVNNRITVR